MIPSRNSPPMIERTIATVLDIEPPFVQVYNFLVVPFSVPLRAGDLELVYLRLLQLAAVIDVDRLPFRENIERRSHRAFAVAVAGGFGPAEGQVDFGAD